MAWFLYPHCSFLLFPTLHHPCPRAGSGREPHKWQSPSAGTAISFWPALFCSVLLKKGQLCSLTFGIFKIPSNPSCPMICLFTFHQLGSAVFSAEFAFWVLGDRGRGREQFLRAVSMSGTSQMHLEKSLAVCCSCLCTGSSVLSMVVVWWCRSWKMALGGGGRFLPS